MPDLAPPAAITAARLQLFAPRCDYMIVAPYLARAALRCEINTPRRVRHWLAQVSVETFGLTRLVESLDYSAERLLAVWPTRFPTLADAEVFAGSPQRLAEKVYGGRLGNVHPGDGARYIGRGGLMRTGLDGYRAAQAAFAKAGITVDLVGMPSMLSTNAYAWDDAANFWLQHGLNDVADADAGEQIYATIQAQILGNETDDLESATRTINGGLTGYPERLAALQRAATIWIDAA